jgi:hypothetical protein
MALPVTVPNTFAGATASIPLSQLDANFDSLSNAINGIANGVETLANVQVTGGSVSNVTITTSNVAGGNIANVTTSNVALQFYSITGSALGTTSGNVTISLADANFYSATTNANATWEFANASPANTLSGVVLALSNGGAYTQTWTNVAWSGGAAPSLTADGLDILVFVSYDAGANWNGMPASLDSQ